jgi:Cof subfamily protein (haloacid dehalogenase superfamily)
MNIRLVALDIDGTLINPGAHFSDLPDESITSAVHALRDAGIVVALASGRMFPGTARVAAHLGIEQPLICQQGASVHNGDGSLRHGYTIGHDVALDLLDYATSNDWPLAWFDSRRYLVTRHCEQAQFFADVSQIQMEVHEEPHCAGVHPTGIDIISSKEDASLVHAEIEARYGDRLCLLDFPSVTAVHSREASKGNALAMLAAELGIEQQQVLAIGDSVNDVSMLDWAGQSAAPEHCDHYARAAAKHILPGPGVSGVAALLLKVCARSQFPPL